MSLSNLTGKIKSDLAVNLKAGQALRVSVLRMLLSEMNYKQIDLGRELTDEDIISVLGREVKKRREAIDSFKQGGRPQQAQTEQEELEILQEYLPKQMSEEEVKSEVALLVSKLSKEEKENFGQAMKTIAPVFKGKADGGLVARLVKDQLGVV